MDENLNLYNAVRKAPATALKAIQAGRLKGKTDVNPMWRIKTLTEQFGPCGFGWATEILNRWVDEGSNGERTTNIEIALRVKMDGEWSEPIIGIGGAMLVSAERNGMFTDDDAWKKAYTDAISVACKALGFAADVYWDKDETKYAPKADVAVAPKTPIKRMIISERLLDNRERCENMLNQLVEAYNADPISFELFGYFESRGMTFDSDATAARVKEIWTHYITNKGIF